MASYVIIEFDRTKPEISIFAPRYTTRDIVTVITIESNEKLSSFQEFYIIDSKGNRHDYTFNKYSDKEFIGRIVLNDVSYGICTLYALVKDMVGNRSDLVSVAIELMEHNSMLDLKLSEYSMNIYDVISDMYIDNKEYSMMINNCIEIMNIEVK